MRVFQGAFEFIERKNLKKKFTAALKILQSFRTFSSFFAKFPDILIVSGEQSNLTLFNQLLRWCLTFKYMLAMRFAMLAAIQHVHRFEKSLAFIIYSQVLLYQVSHGYRFIKTRKVRHLFSLVPMFCQDVIMLYGYFLSHRSIAAHLFIHVNLRWLNTVLRAVSGQAYFKSDKQTWRRKKKTISQNLLIKIL